MEKKYKLTLHLGKHTETGFTSTFKINCEVKGDKPFEVSDTMMTLLDKRVIDRLGYSAILEIDGVFIPNDFDGKGYTIEEAYFKAIRVTSDLFVNMLMVAITGGHSND